MTALDAIRDSQFQASETWARPIGWRGSGQALMLESRPFATRGAICVVPSFRGGEPWTANAAALLDEWELVDPGIVNAESPR